MVDALVMKYLEKSEALADFLWSIVYTVTAVDDNGPNFGKLERFGGLTQSKYALMIIARYV